MEQIAKPKSIDEQMIENTLKWYAGQLNCSSLEELAETTEALYTLCREVGLIK